VLTYLVSNCSIQYQYVSSDHKPLFVVFDRLLSQVCPAAHGSDNSEFVNKLIPDWSKCDDYCLGIYQTQLNVALASVDIPSVLLSPVVANTDEIPRLIDKYYNDIVTCINASSSKAIPSKKSKGFAADYTVPGWNDFVRDKHDAARSAFLDWVHAGKPRQGALNDIMKRTRASFKLAMRYCKQHEDSLRADALACSLAGNDYNKFWNTVRRCNNNKAVGFANVVDGCSGADAINERWRSHFECLYNSIVDNYSASQFKERISDNADYDSYFYL